MKTKLEIINETIEIYSDPEKRSVTLVTGSSGKSIENCRYKGPNGKMCAVARCILPEELDEVSDNYENETVHEIKNLEDYLKPEYRGHSKGFWIDIQILHDDYLNPKRDQKSKEEYIETIKTRYS